MTTYFTDPFINLVGISGLELSFRRFYKIIYKSNRRYAKFVNITINYYAHHKKIFLIELQFSAIKIT